MRRLLRAFRRYCQSPANLIFLGSLTFFALALLSIRWEWVLLPAIMGLFLFLNRFIHGLINPIVWRFRFRWSVPYLEQVLERLGLQYRFDSAESREATQHELLLHRVTIEQYSNRLRIHRYLVPFRDSTDREQYDWFDTMEAGPLWTYDLTGHARAADYMLALDLSWKRDKANTYPQLRCLIRYGLPGELRYREEVMFEVPLDERALGDRPRNTRETEGDGVIYLTDSTGGETHKVWQCQSGGHEHWWEWSLVMQNWRA